MSNGIILRHWYFPPDHERSWQITQLDGPWPETFLACVQAEILAYSELPLLFLWSSYKCAISPLVPRILSNYTRGNTSLFISERKSNLLPFCFKAMFTGTLHYKLPLKCFFFAPFKKKHTVQHNMEICVFQLIFIIALNPCSWNYSRLHTSVISVSAGKHNVWSKPVWADLGQYIQGERNCLASSSVFTISLFTYRCVPHKIIIHTHGNCSEAYWECLFKECICEVNKD